MSKIEQNKLKKQRTILSAAQDVFLTDGYVSASMDQIAAIAGVTKQTVYRYFPSKIELFKATLRHLGECGQAGSFESLNNPDTVEAMQDFAFGFALSHLSDTHLNTERLLIAESGKAPELTATFFEVGPESCESHLSIFFKERFGVDDSHLLIQLWIGMLLSPQSKILLGGDKPSADEVKLLARTATDMIIETVKSQRADP